MKTDIGMNRFVLVVVLVLGCDSDCLSSAYY